MVERSVLRRMVRRSNRLAIVAIQWQLTRALGERFSPGPQRQADIVTS
jgi:hypothetical protein